jgi:hypothetical protein
MKWTADCVGDLPAAVDYFKEKLPGWWFSVAICHVWADASCAPDAEGCDADLLKMRFFDEGFDCYLPPPATMADAIRYVADIAAHARDDFRRSQYDPMADLGGSIREGFQAIRDRVAAGGPGWERSET